ncbi:MAG: putative endonuclease [Oceanicaulis sp. HLUCCA04]|nr:MAG: putative endonuclease [Oceanicaulis sp. HLUCCA04]
MTRAARRQAERQGRRGEWLAIAYLALTGWKIIARRVKTPLGEIDIIAKRHKTLAFMEVKWRASERAALEAFQPRQQARLMRAAALWRSRRTGLNALATRFDLICVTPGRLPKHVKGVLSADSGPENHLI